MKKNILITILLLLSFYTNCQTITFNKLYAPYHDGNSPFLSNSILSKSGGYLVAASGFDTINNDFQSLFFYKIDSVGNATKIISFSRNGYNYYCYRSLIETMDSGYCYVTDMDSANINPIHFIIRFNSNMDTLWTKIIPYDTIFESLRQMCETSDKGFIFVGEKYATPYNGNVLLIKTDSMGNQLWRKIIPMANLSGGGRIIETSDKGFLINGYSASFTYKDGNPFLIKTDSVGDVIWAKYIGGNEYDGGGGMAITKQGDYLFAYGYSTYTYPFNESWSARLNIIKYAPDGSVIWNRMYDTIRNHLGVCKIQVLPNNDFIVMGNHAQPTQGYDYSFFPSFLFKFNANGDSVWRKIYYVADKFGDRNLLADNVLNADGSITACGWVDGDTIVPYEQIWILKTDSMGYAPGPQNVGIIDLPFMHYGTLSVFPNPASTQATISYPQLKTQGQLQIYNMLGQKVYEENLNKNATQTLIDTKDYKKGLYKLVLREKGEIKGYASLIITN